jgi:hypothetical protein
MKSAVQFTAFWFRTINFQGLDGGRTPGVRIDLEMLRQRPTVEEDCQDNGHIGRSTKDDIDLDKLLLEEAKAAAH